MSWGLQYVNPVALLDKSCSVENGGDPVRNNETDSISLHQQMDGDVYDDLRSHFTLLCGTEVDTCLATHKQYSRIWESVAKVCVCMRIQLSGFCVVYIVYCTSVFKWRS